MFIVGSTLVSEELLDEYFVCDLQKCRGACCVQGESGAPLEPGEAGRLEEVMDAARPYLRPEGIEVLEKRGLYEQDSDGDLVTPLVGHHGACAYAVFDSSGVAMCGLEKAFLAGATTWRKPVSCHLYPIRLSQVGEYTALNYHRWPICEPACECGSRLKVPVFRFLREALVRKFGEAWFAQLEEVYAARESARNQGH